MFASSFAVALLLGTLASANADKVAAIAARILDDTLPAEQREALVAQHPELAAELVAAMVANLPPDDAKEEYRRIPWVWRVAIAAGKRNNEQELRSLLEVSLPKLDEELRDWQAVVIGGGVINGLSLEGKWPRERIGDLLHGHEALHKQWQQALAAAANMVDNEQVKAGTRYDALRMIALEPTAMRLEQLAKYLAQEKNAELQMGAVSGLSDVDGPETAGLLVRNFARLTQRNRSRAIDALLRNESRAKKLLLAIEQGLVPADSLSADQIQTLRTLLDAALRKRADQLLPKE